jgi:hypothetical protein
MIILLPKEHSVDGAIEQSINVEGLPATAGFLEENKARSGTYTRSKPKPH